MSDKIDREELASIFNTIKEKVWAAKKELGINNYDDEPIDKEERLKELVTKARDLNEQIQRLAAQIIDEGLGDAFVEVLAGCEIGTIIRDSAGVVYIKVGDDEWEAIVGESGSFASRELTYSMRKMYLARGGYRV